jgi:hypothetical protein
MSRSLTVYRPVNAEGVSERLPVDEATLGHTKPGAHGLPQVVMLSEVSWLDVPALADRRDLYGVQFGERGSPEAGVALVSRKPIRDAELLPGSDAIEGIRARGILRARTGGHAVAAIHVPPPRARLAAEQYLRALRADGDSDVIGGDWNTSPLFVRRSYPARTYAGRGVLGVLLKPDAFSGLGASTPVNVRSDHAAVDVPVYRQTRRRASPASRPPEPPPPPPPPLATRAAVSAILG